MLRTFRVGLAEQEGNMLRLLQPEERRTHVDNYQQFTVVLISLPSHQLDVDEARKRLEFRVESPTYMKTRTTWDHSS